MIIKNGEVTIKSDVVVVSQFVFDCAGEPAILEDLQKEALDWAASRILQELEKLKTPRRWRMIGEK